MELTTDQKGAIAEQGVVWAATKLGIPVLKPVIEGLRYDLVFDLGALVRVQCKWASRDGDVLVVRCYSCRRGPRGMIVKKYSSVEIDAFAAYAPATGRCYFLPVTEFADKRNIYLRLAPTRNNQKTGVRWADDYDFERVDWSNPGAIAQ